MDLKLFWYKYNSIEIMLEPDQLAELWYRRQQQKDLGT